MVTCTRCPGRKFNSPEALKRHKIDSKDHFFCMKCAQDFADFNEVLDHAADVHAPTTCASCRRLFTSKNGLAKHLYDSPKHPKCRSCHIGFRNPSDIAAHKAEFHNTRRSSNKNAKKTNHQKPSPSVASSSNTSNSSTPSPSFRSQSPASSATAENSERDEILRRMLSPLHQAEDMVQKMPAPSPGFNRTPSRTASPHSSSFRSRRGSLNSFDDKVGSRSTHSRTPSPRCRSTPSPRPESVISDKYVEEYERSPADDHSVLKDLSTSSLLLEASVPLPSDSGSDPSIDGEDEQLRYSNQWARLRSSSPLSNREVTQQDDHYENSSLPLNSLSSKLASPTPTYYTARATDTMRSSWRSRRAIAIQSNSPRRAGSPSSMSISTGRTFSQLSRLPTISDELEIDQELELEYDSDALIPLIHEIESTQSPVASKPQRPGGLRKRRLSLSPTLAAIPETANGHELGPLSPIDPGDSDSESSQGIFEHHAEDFLYDSLSENERSHTPMTYLTAEELEFDYEEECPSPSSLVVEDLSKLAREMGSPSSENSDFDPSLDPFNLHPSANNSPMNATFPKRPRAWSVGPPEADTRFLVPAARWPGSENGTRERAESNPEVVLCEPKIEEIDEAAIAADEAPPSVIEDDLFSEPDELGDPITQEAPPLGPVIDATESQFAEEGHPLRSLISLDTLPLSPKARGESGNLISPTMTGHRDSGAPDATEYSLEPDLDRKPRLYCRLCRADPCQDITATFCGHVFCSSCITREVMATSRCPECFVPTLLYCLFKLDLIP